MGNLQNKLSKEVAHGRQEYTTTGGDVLSNVGGGGAGGGGYTQKFKVETLTDSFSNLVFEEWLGSYKLFKVLKCQHRRHPVPVTCKVFAYRDLLDIVTFCDIVKTLKKVRKLFAHTWKTPNVLPYQDLEFPKDLGTNA